MRASTLLLIMLGVASLAAGQTPASSPAVGDKAIKVGIFPFADATASGNRSVGADVGRTMASEVTHSTTLIPRMLAADGSIKAEDLDGEKAVAIGREQKVDLVFVGTVLEAKTQESNKSGWIPSIKGQSGSVSVHRVKATVTLQGELVRRGEREAHLQRPRHGQRLQQRLGRDGLHHVRRMGKRQLPNVPRLAVGQSPAGGPCRYDQEGGGGAVRSY